MGPKSDAGRTGRFVFRIALRLVVWFADRIAPSISGWMSLDSPDGPFIGTLAGSPYRLPFARV